MKYLIKIFLFLYSLCSIAHTAVAMEYKFRYYTDSDGLSSNTVQCFYQDAKGYLWIGTSDGLCRFNSQNFTVFSPNDKLNSTLGSKSIFAICNGDSTEDENIWIGTNAGIYIFNYYDESFTYLPVICNGKEFSNLPIYELVADGLGNIWIGTVGFGVFRYDKATKVFHHYTAESHPDAFANNSIVCILHDSDNNLWITASGSRLLNRYNPKTDSFTTFRVEDSLSRTSISEINVVCQDSFGAIWIAGRGGELFKYEPSQHRFVRNSPEKGANYGRIWCMIEHTQGELLLGTDSGLLTFSGKDRVYNHIDDGMSNRSGMLNDKFVHSLFRDREGGIWAGTYFGGINYISPLCPLFTTIEPGQGCGNIISTLCEDPDGNIWIGSSDRGLSIYNPRTSSYSKVELDSHESALNISTMVVDGEWMWIGTFAKGLYRMNLKNRKVEHFNQPEVNAVSSIFRDSKGILWIGTTRNIYTYNDAGSEFENQLSLGFNGNVVDIAEDMHGHLWFASIGMGLHCFDYGTKTFKRLSDSPDCDLPDMVNCIELDGNILRIGTFGRGLYHYDIPTGKLTKDLSNSVYENVAIMQIIQSGDELYLTTNKGLLRYGCQDKKKKSTTLYTSEDGLLVNIFNSNSGIKSSTGHIYIGSNDGINCFYPNDFARQEIAVGKPEVVFSGFKLLGDESSSRKMLIDGTVDYQRVVKLYGRRCSFSLDFLAINFSSPMRTEYRYRLENSDGEQIKADGFKVGGGIQHVTYINLPSDNYKFRVNATANGVDFGEESIVDIQILPPWWMSAMMKLIYVIFIFIILLALAIRLAQIIASIRNDRKLINEQAENIKRTGIRLDKIEELAGRLQNPLVMLVSPVMTMIEHSTDSGSENEDINLILQNSNSIFSIIEQIKLFTRGNDTYVAPSITEKLEYQPTPIELDSPVRPAILLADSNTEFADFFKRHMSVEYAIDCVTTGSQAIELLNIKEFSAILVNSELNADMNGLRLCELIHENNHVNHIPVILMSSSPQREIRLAGLKAGADIVIDTPISVNYLREQIISLVNQRDLLRRKFSNGIYPVTYKESSDQNFIEEVNKYILDNISNTTLQSEDIAMALNMSRTHFFKRLKAASGITPNEYLKTLRLKVAADMIKSSNKLKLTKIGCMVGFSSSSYFAKCFRDKYGVLPSEYAENHEDDLAGL